MITVNQQSGSVVLTTETIPTSGFIRPVQSNEPFDQLSLWVVPEVDNPYIIEVYFYGRLVESHTFPAPNGDTNCVMMFNDLVFPANLSTKTIPKFYQTARSDYCGIPILLAISNLDTTLPVGTIRSFTTYGIFKTYSSHHNIVRQEP
jgi:hypothetical protein